MDEPEGGRVIRAKSLRRGRPEERITDRIRLERVLGVTVPTNAALANNNNGIVAYPAGCTVILFNARTEQQNHIINISRKTITSLSYSSCGRYIVTGECGHQPAVRVWDLQSDPQSTHPGLAPQPQQVAEFVGHKYGVSCVAFSPNNKYVVSVGTQHDMIVNLWDWRNNVKVASNKVSTKVKAITFAENGSYFVTVGNRHVKFWFLENGKNKYKEAVPLMGRSAILGEQRNNYFCDVACGKGECGDSTYAITRSGLLCEFNNRRLLDKWVELRTTSANCITVGQNYIFVGCAEGIIRCFEPTTLRFITTLPRCHYLGVDVALGTNIRHMATPPQGAKYPDTVAITFDETNNKLTAVYNDHSIYIWDVFNIKRVGKSHSFLYHSACIWGVEMAPPNSPLPPGSFLTCSSDDTVRVWTLDKMTEKNSRGIYQQNIYSKELLKVVYVDKDLSYIKDLDMSRTVNNDKPPDQTSYDGKNGVRCIRVSPDGQHLASGDRTGNIRIHDTSQMKEQCKIEAHDSEVLCLEYSATETHVNLLASASRDRLIHVFDTKHEYNFVQTLDDHSSSITAVRFLNQPQNNVQMISCGADKSLIFRTLKEVNGKAQFVRDQIATGKTTLYDMEVDAGHKHVLTACQDRNVRIYSVNSGKHTKTFKGSPGDDGSLIKVVSDRSGIYMATSCTDKSLSVYDYYSGECMATMCGHGELATGLRFTNDCRRLISASGDGCIFVWRIPHDMVITMQTRLSQQAIRQGKMLDAEMLNESMRYDLHDDIGAVDTNYRFSVGQLPQWAKKQLNEESNQLPSLAKGVAAPKGRWAQRAEASMGVQSFYSSQPLPFPLMDKRFDSDGSKDSSLDSGTEIKHYHEQKNEQIVPKLPPATVNLVRGVMTDDSAIGDVESVAHDGDLDSDSDYRHRPLYYPSLANSPGESEFTVTNIDGEELRKSQRKKKAPQIVIQSGTYDSEDDDDDASTPSGENTDRNPMSLFSVSSESLDQLVNRERYLQATFESMSGADSEPHHSPSNKTSFSSKFLTGGATRNLEAIKAVKQTKSDPEVMKKRQELSKRIAEAKKKLESVGHSSPLRYSQSIHDLSHIPERDKWSKKQEDIPKSESFYLNQNYSARGSQESILSDDFRPKSSCNSLESVLSNESDCKSAPLEILFEDKRRLLYSEIKLNVPHSQSMSEAELSSSLPKDFVHKPKTNMKTCQTQTDFETPQEIVAKKARGSEDFQRKLLKFESGIMSGKKPGTSSLDRHLFAKGLLNNNEKITHKPPKAVRRNNSSKSRKSKVTTYEYIRKEDFYKTKSANFEKDNGNILNNCTDEHTIELCFKEKNLDLDVEASSSQKSNIKLNLLVYVEDVSSPDSSLRRSCSLSDLSMQNVIPKRKQSEPSKKPSAPARITPRYVKNNSMMRSKSSMVLNHPPSDSENDTQEKKMSRLMRPTISSHNKVNQKPLQARKKQSYSTSNLNQVGMDNVSTSDDEENLKKPQVPPRMSRQQGHENGQTSRYISNKDSKRMSRHSIHFDDTLTNEDPELSSESVDLSSIEFSNQLCEEVSRQLVASADNVVKIYQKLKEGEEGGDPQPEALDCIKMSLIRTHKVVHDCIFNEFKQNNGNLDVNQTDALKKLNDLVSKGASGSGSVIDLMQQYSDILLDMLQQKIHSSGNI